MIGRRVREKRSSHSEGKGRPGRARTGEPGFLGVKSIGTPPHRHRHRHRQAGRRHQPARGSPLGSLAPPVASRFCACRFCALRLPALPSPPCRSACPCLCVYRGGRPQTRGDPATAAAGGWHWARRAERTGHARRGSIGWDGSVWIRSFWAQESGRRGRQAGRRHLLHAVVSAGGSRERSVRPPARLPRPRAARSSDASCPPFRELRASQRNSTASRTGARRC